MQRLRLPRMLVLATFCLVGCGVTRPTSVSGDEPAEATTVRAISYNVQFLPGPAAIANKRKNPKYRAEVIGRLMAEFDIVGLNEVFEDNHRELLLSQIEVAWGDDYSVVTGPHPDDGRANGGLAIVTRLPVEATHSVIYKAFSSPKDYGLRADGFAAKGVLHARLRRHRDVDSADAIDVFVTHMEARADHLRPKQYEEMAAFIHEHADPARPVLIMGDFNTRGEREEREAPDAQYPMLIARLTEALPEATLVDTWLHLHADEFGGTTEQESTEVGHRIDYIFVANPSSGTARLEPLAVRVNGYLDDEVFALSDHSAVEADLRWVPRGP